MILVVALVIFGPNKLPELGKSLGSGIREFKKATQALTEEVSKAATEEVTTKPVVAPAPQAATPQLGESDQTPKA